MPVNFNIDLSERRKTDQLVRSKRENEAREWTADLLNNGLQPDEVQSVVNTYIKSGEIRLPNKRTTMLPTDPEAAPDVPYRSTQTPISYGARPKHKKVLMFDEGTGKVVEKDVEGDVEFHNWNSLVGKNTSEKEKPETPQQKAWRDVLNQYNNALSAVDKDGNPRGVSKEMAQQAMVASRNLGIPMTRNLSIEPGKLGFAGAARNAASVATRGFVKPAAKPPAEIVEKGAPTMADGDLAEQNWQFNLERAQKAVASGRITNEEAQKRLRRAFPEKFQ